MLISFSIENWMSFRDPASFSMIASREKQHGKRIPKVAKFHTRFLPVATISGGNTSGKTNLFQALCFVKWLVLTGTGSESPIPIEPYRLDSASIKKPSRFQLVLLINEIIYEFSFALTRKEIVEEKLVKITSSSEKILYDRKGEALKTDPSINKDLFLHSASKSARDNQLLLTNLVSQNVDIFRPVYDWFKDNLVFIAPDSRFGFLAPFIAEGHPLFITMNEMLQQLDTEISHLGEEDISFDDLSLPKTLKKRLEEDVKEGMTIRLPNNEPIIITRKAGELVAKKLVSFHLRSKGTAAKFDLSQESNGIQRLIHLLPAFLELSASNSKKVYVIDEIDRSLHSLLTRQLIEAFLENCRKDSRAQLLIATHNLLLMDQGLFRRDEMWVAERNRNGISELYSVSEFKDVRHNKDIRKSYLQGRFGGIPRFR